MNTIRVAFIGNCHSEKTYTLKKLSSNDTPAQDLYQPTLGMNYEILYYLNYKFSIIDITGYERHYSSMSGDLKKDVYSTISCFFIFHNSSHDIQEPRTWHWRTPEEWEAEVKSVNNHATIVHIFENDAKAEKVKEVLSSLTMFDDCDKSY